MNDYLRNGVWNRALCECMAADLDFCWLHPWALVRGIGRRASKR